MKKLLSFVLLILIGCTKPEPEPVNIERLVEREEGIYYTMDTNKPYSGPVFYLDPIENKKQQILTLKNGKKEGPYKSFYWNNGNLMLEGTYKNGVKDGIERWYDNDGELEEEKTYINGELIERKEY